jgi:hypothetical protein
MIKLSLQATMVTYVLGAGASIHAGYPLAGRLGEALYDWAIVNRPATCVWRSYIESLRELYGNLSNLEEILTELDECPPSSRAASLTHNSRGNTRGAIRALIPEFFNSLREPSVATADLYHELARSCVRQDDVIVTFNYDLACERALKIAGLWQISDGYGFPLHSKAIPPSKLRILKMHGSTNWIGILFDGNMGFSQVSGGAYGPRPTLLRKTDFGFFGYPDGIHDPHCEHISVTGGDPALILPTLHKDFFHQTSFGREWEPFWDHIWGQAQEALRSADEIAIIGYSMPLADERARRLLLQESNHGAVVSIFCGRNTSDLCEEFRTHGFERVKSRGAGCFKDFLGI